MSTTELALAEAKYAKAKAELALAQVHLDFTQVRAPFDGIMDHFYVRQGSLVEEGELRLHFQTTTKCGFISMCQKQSIWITKSN